MNKNLLVLLILVLGAVPALAQDTAGAIVVDGSGNLYKIGPSTKVIGEGEGYVTIKYDDKGNQLWVAHYNDPTYSEDLSGTIELDESANSYVTLKNSKDEKLATICYSPNGNEVWVRKYDDSTGNAYQKPISPPSLSKASTPPPYEDGWPFVGVIMNYNIDQSLVAGNLDVSDAQEELVLCMYDNVYAWNHDGTLMNGWPIRPENNVNFRGASIGVQGGIGKVAFATGEYANMVYLFNYDASEPNGWPKSNLPHSFIRSPVWADIDGDGVMEVIAIGGSTVYAWNPDGSDVPGWPLNVDVTLDGIAVGDVNNDGKIEVVASNMVLCTGKRVYVISSEGEILYQWRPNAECVGSENNRVLADLDKDGDLEIILSGWNDIIAYHHDGQQFWPRKILEDYIGSVAVGDLEGDDSLEVVLCGRTHIYVWNQDGSTKQGWPVSIPNVGWNNLNSIEGSGPAIGDIDGDGEQEIVVNGYGNGHWYIYAFNPNGTVVDGFPYIEQAGFDATSTPVIADLDKDGNVEICSYGQSHEDPYYTHLRVVVYDVGTPYDSSRMDWPMFQHDSQRTGCFESVPIGERMRGDVNEDGKITVSDVIYLINYLFKGGPAPAPLEVGDVNCDSSVTVSDVIYLINYLFKGGPPPC